MAATKDDISGWFDRGVSEGAKFMLVICDTYDYDDYPMFFSNGKDCAEKFKKPGNMQSVMECYDLTADKDAQMRERRAMRLPPEATHD